MLRRALKVDATFQIETCTRAYLKNCFDRTDPHLNALISRGVRAHIFKSARAHSPIHFMRGMSSINLPNKEVSVQAELKIDPSKLRH